MSFRPLKTRVKKSTRRKKFILSMLSGGMPGLTIQITVIWKHNRERLTNPMSIVRKPDQ
jgi:hypothetical protein